MANTLTNLLPELYSALDVVSRELVGFIPAVTRNSSAERAALNESIRFPIVPAIATANIVPGVTPPDTGDAVIGSATLAITKSKYAPVRWNGEEEMGVGNTGVLNVILRDQFAQAMRALVNEVETDLGALSVYASRAVGIPGTTPFNTAADFSEFANSLRVLDDNGAPPSDRHLVLGSAPIANIRGKQSLLFKANEAGTTELLRQGIIGMVEGLAIHNSAAAGKAHTNGTGANYITNSTTLAIGTTSIPIDTGTGTVLAGDVITITGDANEYVVTTGVTAPGTIVIAGPGLRKAAADNAAVTISTAYSGAGLAFHRSAIQLLTRAPAMPKVGDMADDVTEVQDELSGLAFQVAMYKQFRQVQFQVGLAWGCSAVKGDHIVLLRG